MPTCALPAARTASGSECASAPAKYYQPTSRSISYDVRRNDTQSGDCPLPSEAASGGFWWPYRLGTTQESSASDDYLEAMIFVTRLDGSPILINEDLIESIEQTPDTVLSLVNGDKLMVRDDPKELVQRVIDFKRLVSLDRVPSDGGDPR
jgi:flagellar protein FlbD